MIKRLFLNGDRYIKDFIGKKATLIQRIEIGTQIAGDDNGFRLVRDVPYSAIKDQTFQIAGVAFANNQYYFLSKEHSIKLASGEFCGPAVFIPASKVKIGGY